MCTEFSGRHGILLVDFMPRGKTTNAAAYCETHRKVHRSIENKRRVMLQRSVVLIHDNTRSHKAIVTQQLLMDCAGNSLTTPLQS